MNRAKAIHHNILNHMVFLCSITGLPKEMRLYGKLQLELSESLALVSR